MVTQRSARTPPPKGTRDQERNLEESLATKALPHHAIEDVATPLHSEVLRLVSPSYHSPSETTTKLPTVGVAQIAKQGPVMRSNSPVGCVNSPSGLCEGPMWNV